MTSSKSGRPASVDPEAGWGLVLGGGGSVGSAYIAGVLKGLEEAGLDAGSAGLVVGTSAGAFVGARIRLGDRPDQFLELANATPHVGREASHYQPAWDSPSELARRLVGAGGVVARSILRAPLPLPSERLSQQFPPGLFRVRDQAAVARLLPEEWPEKPIWSVAVDLGTSRRVALGSRPEHLRLPFRDAIMASCSVPGFYEPIRMNGTLYVDGGVRSTTHLDLAIRHGCTKVLCIVPMGYEGRTPPNMPHQILRNSAMRGVRRELNRVGNRVDDVMLIQPPIEDLEVHGSNVLRATGNQAVFERAYAQATGHLMLPGFARFIHGLGSG